MECYNFLLNMTFINKSQQFVEMFNFFFHTPNYYFFILKVNKKS